MGNNNSRTLLTKIFIIFPVLCCVSVIILVNSPVAECFDMFSGKAPKMAIERFIQMLISATLEGDYSWIALNSTEDAFNKMKYLHERTIVISEEYTIDKSDDLAGIYEYDVNFEKGTLRLDIEAIWPTCPDFEVTEDEILENIRLINVKSPIIPLDLPIDEER